MLSCLTVSNNAQIHFGGTQDLQGTYAGACYSGDGALIVYFRYFVDKLCNLTRYGDMIVVGIATYIRIRICIIITLNQVN